MTDAILDTNGRRLIQFWISDDFCTVIDRWRDKLPDTPSRVEAIRRLTALGLAGEMLKQNTRPIRRQAAELQK